jgi:chemotaxis protein CheC
VNALAPTPLQLDALREVANVGCGHAANVLSQLVGGRTVRIEVPRVVVTRASELHDLIGGPDARVVAISLGVSAGLGGKMLLIWSEQDAETLCSLLLGNVPPGLPVDEPRASALREVANIVASACLSAIGRLVGLTLLPSPPDLLVDEAEPLLERVRGPGAGDEGRVVVLEARFLAAAAPPLSGQLLVLPEQQSLETLLSHLGL